MKTPYNFLQLLTTLSATLLLAGHVAPAAVLLNFGGSSYTGVQSPGFAHDPNLTGASAIWNSAAIDVSGTLLDWQGNSLPNLALNFGTTTTAAGTTVDYSAATKVADYSIVASAAGTIFDTPLGSSNAARDTGSTFGIAVAIDGLAPGEYNFYLTSLRMEGGGTGEAVRNRRFNVYAGVDTAGITDFSSYGIGQLGPMGLENEPNFTSWINGVNYATGSFVIDGSNTVFSVMSNGINFNDSDYIGVLTSLEIVAVPEPAHYASLTGILVIGLIVVRRRRIQVITA